MPGKLSIIATPIGNLEDITIRAVKTLQEADLILAEDTRSTRNLLAAREIPQKPLLSFFEGNEQARITQILEELAKGKNIALVSESGTPLISDPGYKLIRKLIEEGMSIESIPGPTALIAALTISGLPSNAFVFLGFLPKKKGKIQKIFKELDKLPENIKTAIFYESPHRILQTLQAIKEHFGNINLTIARELTKVHEEVRRENIVQSIKHFEKTKPRGEFTILFLLNQTPSTHF